MVAATAGLRPRSMRCGAWCRLMPACTGKTAIVNSDRSQNAGVRRASFRVKAGSAIAACALPAPGGVDDGDSRSGSRPTSSGRRIMNSQLGTKPMRRTATPTASHPARQPSRSMARWAIRGSATRPAICARLAIEVAKARRATNQLFRAP